MKIRVWRHFKFFAKAVSLVLCLAIVGLWLRSNWYLDGVSHGSPHGALIFNSVCGRVYIMHQMLTVSDSSRPSQWYWRDSQPMDTHFLPSGLWGHAFSVSEKVYEQHELLGFAWSRYFWGAPLTEDVLVLPYYALFLLTAVLPIRWGLEIYGTRKKRRRAMRGLCGSCGYSLTGNTSGVCPECGERI